MAFGSRGLLYGNTRTAHAIQSHGGSDQFVALFSVIQTKRQSKRDFLKIVANQIRIYQIQKWISHATNKHTLFIYGFIFIYKVVACTRLFFVAASSVTAINMSLLWSSEFCYVISLAGESTGWTDSRTDGRATSRRRGNPDGMQGTVT